MSDIFLKKDVANLLRGKYLLLLGSSNMRALYRDLIWLLQKNTFVPENDLRLKLDFSYLGDRLLKQGQLNRGRDYIEMREYKDEDFHIRFNFLTKLYTEEVEVMMNEIKKDKFQPPDIVLINSCIWDITRWGPDGVNLYKKNMHKVMSIFKESLPPRSLVIYSTSLPISPSCYGAFLIKQVEFMKHNLRFDIMEANLFAKQVVPTYGYNILDFHYHLRMQIHWRMPDGVHWQPIAVRHMSNLLLTHIALCYGKPLPGNFKGRMLERYHSTAQEIKNENLNLKLSKLAKLFKEPRILQQHLKRIPRHIKDDVNNMLKTLHSRNNHPYSNKIRDTFRHNQNQNAMYRVDHHNCLQDKENQGSRYGRMNTYPDSPNNNTYNEKGDKYSQSRYFDGTSERRRFGPTNYNEFCDNSVLRRPDSFEGRFYDGGRNENGLVDICGSNRNARMHSLEGRDSFPNDEFRAASYCSGDERYNSRGRFDREENFDAGRSNDNHNFRSDSFRRDNSLNGDRGGFNDSRRSFEDRRRSDSSRDYDRNNSSYNDSRGSDFCGDENAYNDNRYPDCGLRNNVYNENRSVYNRGDDSGSENFYCDRGGRRDCNRVGGNDICFTNLEQLSYSNNNYDILSPYEQRNIFSPLRDNRNILNRQRRLPYKY